MILGVLHHIVGIFPGRAGSRDRAWSFHSSTAPARSPVAAISMPCSALVPPAFVDYVLRQDLAEGVLISGCCEGDCFYRLGNTWLDQRFSMERMPVLRTRVPRERVRLRWLGAQGTSALQHEVAAFQQELRDNLPGQQEAGPLEAGNG